MGSFLHVNLFVFLRAPKYSLFLNWNFETQGPHNLPVWDFRQEEARKHWIEGWLQILSATISYTRKNGQYSCKHLLASFFQEPFIPWQQAMAALVGFSSMEQVVPIIHKDNIYKHTLGFIWQRFVFFLHLEGVFPSSSLFIQCFGRSESSMQKWMFRWELNNLWFLDALASLELKLSVSQWVSDLPFFQ